MQKQFLPRFIFLTLIYSSFCYPQNSSEIDSINWAVEKINIGIKNISDSTLAIKNFKEALKIGEKTKNNQLIHDSAFRLGYQYYSIDDRKKALYYLRKSIEWEKYSERLKYRFNSFYAIAVIHYRNNDFNMALDSLSVAEKVAKTNKNVRQTLLANSLRIIIYSYLNQNELAQQLLLKSVKISQNEKDAPFLYSLYGRIADLSMVEKKFDKAITYYEKSNKIIDKLNVKNLLKIKAYNYNKIGKAYTKKQEFDLARKSFLFALKLSLNNHIQYHSLVALLYLTKLDTELGNYKSAFKYLSQIDSMGNNGEDEIFIMRANRIGNLYQKLNQVDSALYYYKKSLKFTEKRKSKVTASSFRIGFNRRDHEKALKIAAIYKNLYDSTNSIAYFDSLFKYVNSSRSRSLFENSNKLIPKNINPYLVIEGKVEKLYKDIRNLEQNDSRVIDDLDYLKYGLVSKRIEVLKDKVSDYKETSRADFQKYLAKKKSSSVTYVINKNDSYAVYIDENKIKVIDLFGSANTLQKKIKEFLSSAFYSSDINDLQFNTKLAYELYLSLWRPIEIEIELLQNVIIIPDQNILNLPFDVLINQNPEKEVYSINDKPDFIENLLIHKHNFAYLPSANLIKTFKKPNENQNVLLVANPKFNDEYNISPEIINHTGWAFDPLLYSKAEIKLINKLYKNAVVFNGGMASKSYFKGYMGSSNIIHFATHAFIDTAFHLFSGLIFSMSKDSIDNGFLLGYEIEQLDLNCDLVTLSACESGKGKIISAEGVMGLPRLFFSAGARSVLMTLWKVDDMQTAALTPLFYKNIQQQQLSKIEALGEAK